MKKKMYAWVLSIVCLLVAFLGKMPVRAEVIHETDLEEYILKEMSEAHVMNMGVSIVSPEREVYCANYGAETQTDRDYVLGELTQSFTAAAIMCMVEDSEIALDATVGHYLSGEQYLAVRDVKIRELLNQTSGISVYETMSDISASGTRGQFEAAPVNYNLLGEIIEKISGLSYEEYVADNILDPLKMESTHTLRNNPEFGNHMVPGYRYYFRFPFETENRYDAEDEWMQVSSGLIISDVKDMGKYLQMYLKNGGKVLNEESVSSMLSDDISVNYDSEHLKRLFDSSTRYGMGWLSAKVAGKQVYYYTGKSENSTTGMFLLPEQKLGIAVLFNSADYSGQDFLEKLERGIISIELGEKPEEFTNENYFQKNIIFDIGIVLLVLASWFPIFLISVWGARRRKKLCNIPGIMFDIAIHLVLPTVLLLKVQEKIPFVFLHRLYPDNFYVTVLIIGSLYFGALIKVIATIVFAILGPKSEEDVGDTKEQEKNTDSEVSQTENQAEKPVQEPSSGKNQAEKKPVQESSSGENQAEKKTQRSLSAEKKGSEIPPVTETIVQKSTIKEVRQLEDSSRKMEIKIPPVNHEKTVEMKKVQTMSPTVKNVETKKEKDMSASEKSDVGKSAGEKHTSGMDAGSQGSNKSKKKRKKGSRSQK